MLSWYHYGIVQKNMGAYAAAVVSFEKAANLAKSLNESRYLGLIYRNISSSFSLSNNIPSAILYIKKAIDCFRSNPEDSLYLQYAIGSLATLYYVDGNYEESSSALEEIINSENIGIKRSVNSLQAKICIMAKGDYRAGIQQYLGISQKHLSYHDCSTIALAYNYLNNRDSSNYWINRAYSLAKDQADSATIDYIASNIYYNRGRVDEAYGLLKHSTMVQDSLTRVILSESVSSAQRDFFREEAEKESIKLAENRRRSLLSGVIGVLVFLLIIIILLIRSWKKDQWLKDLMAKEAIQGQSIRQLSKDNATLLSTHYSERIRQIDNIAREYYLADSKAQKDIVFKQFKEYVGNLSNSEQFYLSIEKDLNMYCNGVMEKLRLQVPSIQNQNLKNIILFFAGLSYETVAIITRAQSINGLKMQRSRLRKAIETSNATDKALFLEMLEIKRPQARKKKE